MNGPVSRKNQQLEDAVLKKKPKTKYQRKWEGTFGKHTARCHPQSFIKQISKEGKPILLLVIIGTCASILDFTIETAVEGLGMLKTKILALGWLHTSSLMTFAAWSAFTIVVATLGCIWTVSVDRFAAGSGIPEMKTIISCDLHKQADQYLGARTFFSKAVGLAFALGSGISVGREGPFVHTSSIIAHRLMKHIGFFRRIYKNDILRRHVYNAACAVGVASTFRAPIGGVLFSIEVTSTVFMVSNYWRAFVAALSGSIIRQLVSRLRHSELSSYHPMFPTEFEAKSFTYAEYIGFALVSLLMGIAGATYVVSSNRFKQWWKARSAHVPVVWGLLLLIPVCLLLYLPGSIGQSSSSEVITNLCSTKELPSEWTDALSSIFVMLPLAAICRLVATVLSTSLLLPAGDFIPTFTAGALFGRLIGEIALVCFPDCGIVPGGYALVGGASLVASVTHTVSVAVIAMEFTGQFVYLNPLLLSVLVASSVGSALSVSIYDSVIISKGLMYLPILRVNLLEDVKARDVMEIDFPLLAKMTSIAKLEQSLLLEPTHSIPVVSDMEAMVFYGCVARKSIEELYHDRRTVAKEYHTEKGVPESKQAAKKENECRRCSSPNFRAQQHVDLTEIVPHHRTSLATLTKHPRLLALDEDNQRDRDDDGDDEPIYLRNDENFVIDSSVLQVDAETAIAKVHLFFEMIKCSRIWVTRRGKLIGRIDRAHLHAKILALKKERRIHLV
uniref:Chloride channel protein n=1 Tax=Globisporangium ultimum (strain ATCC 200006 / CBS 805.95 / DAOM BR144) TaxID=431595 RepID=K3X5Y7_GLOUD